VFSSGYRVWLLTLLVATYACSFIDRLIVATIGPAIIKDLSLSDLQFGLLGGFAFAVFYSAFGLPVARLAERRNRIDIISTSVALWSAMTVLSGLVTSYWQLLVCRMGVGVGEAGCTPPAHSLISDHYPAQQRASILAIYSLGVPFGVMLGAVAGGWMAETFSWRTAFVVVGAPGLLLAVIVKLTLREPPRGHADGAAPALEAPPLAAVLRRVWDRRSFIHVCAGCSIATTASTSINLFAPSHFVRSFGMGMADVGLLYGLIMGVATTAGMLAGGFGADLGARRDVRWYAWAPAAGVAMAAPLHLIAYSRSAPASASLGILLGGLSMSICFAPSFAVVQNMVEPRMRASAIALVLLSMNVVGQGIGPSIMGFASDAAASRAFSRGNYADLCLDGQSTRDLASACAVAAATGLQRAILGASVLFFWGALHFGLAGKSLSRDLADQGQRTVGLQADRVRAG
jgi:MFS family permease